MADLRMIYIAANPHDQAPELHCSDHPDWWTDADGTDLPTVIRHATDHFRDEHRVHVTDCMCRGTQVTDQRCIPHIVDTGSTPSGGAA